MNSLGKDSTILEKEWGKYEKHIFLKTDFLCVEPICRDHLSRLYSVQRTLYRKQLPCSFSIFVALVFDAAYISYKNVKCNKVLNHFSYCYCCWAGNSYCTCLISDQYPKRFPCCCCLSVFISQHISYRHFYFRVLPIGGKSAACFFENFLRNSNYLLLLFR